MNDPRPTSMLAPASVAPDQLDRQPPAALLAILEHLPDPWMLLDPSGRLRWMNQAAATLPLWPGGADRSGQPAWQQLGPEGQQLEAACQQARSTGQPLELTLALADGSRHFDLRVQPDADGVALAWHDVTDRARREHHHGELNARLQQALAAGRLGDWHWHVDSDTTILGQATAELFGLPAGVPLGWDLLGSRIHEADRELVSNQFRQALHERADINLECRVRPAPGKEHGWIAVVGRPDLGPDGRVHCMNGVVQDISTRKDQEDTLRQSEEVLRALANTIPQLAWMAEADGAIVWFNQRWYEYTGTQPSQMEGWGWTSTTDPDVLPLVLHRWRDSIRTGIPFEMEYPIRGADGHHRWFLTRVSPVRDRSGAVLRWFGTNTDVDQVKRVQQALRDESNVLELLNSTGRALASQRDLRSLLQTVTDAATGISGARFGAFFYQGRDDDGDRFTLYALSGVSHAEFERFSERSASALFAPRQGQVVVRLDDLLEDPRHAQAARELADADGRPAVRSYLAVPVIARSGETFGTLFFGHPEARIFSERTQRIVSGIAAQAAVAIDNTRLYEAAHQAAEERKVLLESERSARAEAERTSQMKDEFLATLSHELRTPLSAILGWAQVLRRGSRDQSDLQRGLQTIERNARAQAQLIEDLLDMSRITSGKVLLDVQILAPAMFADAAIETVRPAADAKNIRIEKDYDPAVSLIAGDAARLQQVIWNLLSNALKFTPRDGTVRVRLRQVDGHVQIEVHDNGVGIKPDFMAHVFERFRQGDASTTRKHGGLGLGLSIVKHLIEQHGGTVRVDSPGELGGASFTIELPAANRQAQWARADRPSYQVPAPATSELVMRDLAGVQVLVVDDEADARELIKRILTDCHAEVRTAASAAEAIRMFRQAPPDVLISDLGMPDVDGFELLTWVRDLGPGAHGEVPALALTAFARSEDKVRALEAGFEAHLPKPVEPSELITVVANLAGKMD